MITFSKHVLATNIVRNIRTSSEKNLKSLIGTGGKITEIKIFAWPIICNYQSQKWDSIRIHVELVCEAQVGNKIIGAIFQLGTE